jgi:hypothetical protein
LLYKVGELECSGACLAQRNSAGDQCTREAPRLAPRPLAPSVLEPPAGRPRPAPRALLLKAPPAILCDAFVCVIVRNVHSMKMMYDEHGC